MSTIPNGVRGSANSSSNIALSIEQASRQRQDHQLRSTRADRDREDGDRASYQVTLSNAARQFSSQETTRVYAKAEPGSVGNKPVAEQRLEHAVQNRQANQDNQQAQLSAVRALERYTQTAALDGKLD